MKRRRRVWWFLAFVTVAGGYLGYLFTWRHELPAAPAHARVKPALTTLPTLSVCWLETGKIFDNTGSSLLIRHPKGDLLVDAGNSSHFADEVAGYAWRDRFWLRALPGALGPSLLLPAALTAAGADPAKVQLLISHAHIDHVGGLMDLPSATPVWMAQPELDWVSLGHGPEGVGVVPAHAARLKGHMQPLQFVDAPYEIFDQHADLFGDGSVVVVPLYGHTPGSVGVFVNITPTQRLFHVGDAAHDWRGLEKRLSEAPILVRTNWDTKRSEDVLAALSAYHEAAPEIAMLPAHARQAWLRAFGAPNHCTAR